MVFRLFSVALSTVEVGNLFGLFSVDGSGRWIPSDGRRRKKKTRERESGRDFSVRSQKVGWKWSALKILWALYGSDFQEKLLKSKRFSLLIAWFLNWT